MEVQYFSHLNGLTLSNNWGDLIRLLDKALVTGFNFTEITSALIDEQGDVHITLYSDHNALLFQIVELSGFTPNSLNQKYRIKGTPSSTKLILKPSVVISELIVTTLGSAKLASLGYEIIFRDNADVKRVYRAKNPNTTHPFIRIDESLSGDGVYNSSFAKSAMVGLIEYMSHIDDFEKMDILQIPFDSNQPAKNWSISDKIDLIRGWSKWYWNVGYIINDNIREDFTPPDANISFTLCGDRNAFYFTPGAHRQIQKQMWGCGVYRDSLDLNHPWFLFSATLNVSTNTTFQFGNVVGGTALVVGSSGGAFTTTSNIYNVKEHKLATPILPNWQSGGTEIFNSSNLPALEIPFYDEDKFLRGTLMHVCYMGKKINSTNTAPEISNKSMYIKENLRMSVDNQASTNGIYFYLGELE